MNKASIEDMRAVQVIRWDEEQQAYVPESWVLQYKRGINQPWEDVAVQVNYVGGEHHGKSTVNKKDIEQ